VLNKIMLIGNLGKDPQTSYTPDGVAFTRFSLAVSRNYKTNSGEKREETEWFNVVAWRQLAEICANYLHKGSKVYIEGRLTQRKYTDPKTGQERVTVDVIASDMEMLTPKSTSGGASPDILAGNLDEFAPEDSEEFP
jgi:single-strand DNA-binding protein